MKYALYGFIAAALVVISGGCASPCFGPLQGPISGGGCTGSCGGSALDTMFGNCGCGDDVATASSGCASASTGADSGCPSGCGGAGCGGCVGAPIVNSGRRLATAANGTGSVGGTPVGGGMLSESGLLRGAGGGVGGALGHPRGCGLNLGHRLHNACLNGTCGHVMGPTAGMVQYPYYTTRGPRDFLLNNPPSIGP